MLTDLLFHHDLSLEDAFSSRSRGVRAVDAPAHTGTPIMPPSIPPAAELSE